MRWFAYFFLFTHCTSPYWPRHWIKFQDNTVRCCTIISANHVHCADGYEKFGSFSFEVLQKCD